jgi:hypothetical protein
VLGHQITVCREARFRKASVEPDAVYRVIDSDEWCCDESPAPHPPPLMRHRPFAFAMLMISPAAPCARRGRVLFGRGITRLFQPALDVFHIKLGAI